MIKKSYYSKISVLGHYRWSFFTQGLFYMFLLTSPLNVYGLGSGAFNYRFSRIFLIATVLAIVMERMARMRNFLFKMNPFECLIGVYAILAFASVFYVSDYSAFATRFFGLIECILILYVVRMFTYEEGYFVRAVQVYLLSSIAVLLASGYQVANFFIGTFDGTILPFPSLQLLDSYEELNNWAYFGGIAENATRVSSTFAEPNMLSGYCASLLPYAIVMLLVTNRYKIRQWCIYFNLFLLIGLVLMVIASVSKTGFLSMLLGAALTLKFIFKKISSRQKKWTVIVLGLIISCCVLYGLQFSDFIVMRISEGDSGHMEYTLNAWNDFINFSWWRGEGFGQYEYVSAHSIVLTALCELGLLGGFLMVIMTIHPLIYIKYLSFLSRKMNYDHRVGNYFFLMSACFASYVSILLGLYLYDYWLHPFTWISIALFMSMISHIKREFKSGILAN